MLPEPSERVNLSGNGTQFPEGSKIAIGRTNCTQSNTLQQLRNVHTSLFFENLAILPHI